MPEGSTRINKALSNISVQYKNDEYIFSKVLKDTNVINESDMYWVYNADYTLPETIRANGAPANMVTWSASTSTYRVDEHALKDVVTERDRDNAETPLSIDRDTVEFLTDKILLRQEYEAQKLLFTTTTFSNNTTFTSGTSWKVATSTANPIINVLSATGKILSSSGKRPNVMVMGWATLEALKNNSLVYNRIQYVERAIVTEEILQAVFDVQSIYVGTAVMDTSKEGVHTSTAQGFLWGDDCLLAYFAPSVGRKVVTAATNFRVKKKGLPYRVKKWYDESIEGTYIEVQTMCKPKAVATSAAYLFKDCAASTT